MKRDNDIIPKDFTDKEQEVIYLKILVDTIDSIINSKIIELKGSHKEVTVYFETNTHQKYFYIILVDFLSKINRLSAGTSLNCVDLLKSICEAPQFNIDNSISFLKDAFNTFNSWLNQEVTVKIWLPSIGKECLLKLKREDFIKICGNISKHHFARLDHVSKQIEDILKSNKYDISSYDSLLVLNEFYERFHNDILVYHGSNIAEMMNNIRLGIHEYLLPEFNKSYKKDKSNSYSYNYTYPEDVNNDFVKKLYWDLMNSVRAKPPIGRFESTKYLKLRY